MILVFAESKNGRFKKNAYEISLFGSRIAETTGEECAAVVLGENEEVGELGKYGIKKVYHVNTSELNDFDDLAYRDAIAGLADELGAGTVLLSHTAIGKALVGRLSVRLQGGCVSAVKGFENSGNGLTWIKPVFSGKAFAFYQTASPKAVVSLIPNSISISAGEGTAEVVEKTIEFSKSKATLVERNVITGKVPLPEAELVVSAGRGMKGPENWGIIESLAEELNATTACSRPVADSEWRPHHEHVGQTGIAIRPNLYIAIGISGAIQHLAGVNNSKVIVVINKDREAPFFKAADYGVCADLFDVVPKLTEAVKRFKAEG
jgi:electron transfer flavoprotein alpha subunit